MFQTRSKIGIVFSFQHETEQRKGVSVKSQIMQTILEAFGSVRLIWSLLTEHKSQRDNTYQFERENETQNKRKTSTLMKSCRFARGCFFSLALFYTIYNPAKKRSNVAIGLANAFCMLYFILLLYSMKH